MSSHLEFLRNLQQLLDEGVFVATYKHALIQSLADLAIERPTESDGAIVPIYYESRLAKVKLSEKGKKLIQDLDHELDQKERIQTQAAKAKWTQLADIIGHKERI